MSLLPWLGHTTSKVWYPSDKSYQVRLQFRSIFHSYSKSTGRSHSTPETEASPKPFPSRTYHTIKDMISSRFSKTKTDQIPETGLNNSESNEATAKADNNLSPHSQLVQRGVYLGSSQSQQQQSCPRNTNHGSGNNNGIDAAKRGQDYREQAMGQYRERAVDIGQTAGVSQQSAAIKVPPADGTGGRGIYDMCPSRPAPSRPPPLDGETPNRYRDPDQRNLARNSKFEQMQSSNMTRSVKRLQGTDGLTRSNELRNSTSTGKCSVP